MKKTLLFLALAVAITFTGCQKENTQIGASLVATVEQQSETNETKTYMESLVVKWSDEDAIKVFYSSGNSYKFDLVFGSGTISAQFDYDGSTSGTPLYAIYPYSEGAAVVGNDLTFTLPATQYYAANSFGNGANVAVGQVSNAGTVFKNVCGSLKLALKGHMKVQSIELTGKGNEKLNGAFKVNNINGTCTFEAVKNGEPAGDEEKKLTLNCGEGVQLDAETTTSFYFIVPVSAFASGFDAKITDVAGNSYFTTISTSENNTISRSSVVAMPSKAVSLLPAGFAELQYIENTHRKRKSDLTGQINYSPYFNTHINPSAEGKVETEYQVTEKVSGSGMTQVPFGGYASDVTNFGLLMNGNGNAKINLLFGNQKGIIDAFMWSAGVRGKVVFDGLAKKLTINDKVFQFSDLKGFTGEANFSMYIFTNNGVGSLHEPYERQYPLIGKMYYFKYFESSVLQAYFVPAKVTATGKVDYDDNDVPVGEVGMYDLITKKFFVNQLEVIPGDPSTEAEFEDSPELVD